MDAAIQDLGSFHYLKHFIYKNSRPALQGIKINPHPDFVISKSRKVTELFHQKILLTGILSHKLWNLSTITPRELGIYRNLSPRRHQHRSSSIAPSDTLYSSAPEKGFQRYGIYFSKRNGGENICLMEIDIYAFQIR